MREADRTRKTALRRTPQAGDPRQALEGAAEVPQEAAPGNPLTPSSQVRRLLGMMQSKDW